MSTAPAPVAIEEPPPAGPALKPCLTVLIAAAVVFVVALVPLGLNFWHTVFGDTYATPGQFTVHLDEGTWVLFEEVGHTDSFGPVTVTRSNGTTITARSVAVQGPTGALDIRTSTRNESIGRAGDNYAPAVEFDAPVDGDYTVEVRSGPRSRVMLVRPFFEWILRPVWALVVAVVANLVMIGALIVLLIGVSRRGRQQREAFRRAQASAAWFPDPEGLHRWRWWDGFRWTDHTAD